MGKPRYTQSSMHSHSTPSCEWLMGILNVFIIVLFILHLLKELSPAKSFSVSMNGTIIAPNVIAFHQFTTITQGSIWIKEIFLLNNLPASILACLHYILKSHQKNLSQYNPAVSRLAFQRLGSHHSIPTSTKANKLKNWQHFLDSGK